MRGGIRLPFETLAPYLLIPNAAHPLPQLAGVFGNDWPIELEVGFGKGAFLVESAAARPEVNFLGIELDAGLWLFVANRVAKRALHNVRLLKGDAAELLPRFPDASFAAIHVNFPDPWWKRRHRKRRVFTEAFARQCARLLNEGGTLHLATDVEEYFQVMQRIVAKETNLRPLSIEEVAVPAIQTNFERKARVQGRSVFRAAYQAASLTS